MENAADFQPAGAVLYRFLQILVANMRVAFVTNFLDIRRLSFPIVGGSSQHGRLYVKVVCPTIMYTII
jgi:hypothetical protein